MRYPISAVLILMLLKVSGCREEKFVPDPNDPRLPKYTESGNEVAGALISNVAWKTKLAISYDVPGFPPPFYIHNYPNSDSLIVTINGTIIEGINKDVPIYFSNQRFRSKILSRLEKSQKQEFRHRWYD